MATRVAQPRWYALTMNPATHPRYGFAITWLSISPIILFLILSVTLTSLMMLTGKALIEYWLRVSEKKEFQIAQIRVLPNHCHLRVWLLPTTSPLECVLALMNNSWAMMNRRFWGLLKQTDAWDVWEPSVYAGTTGDVTTAEVKAYLNSAG